ncbi:TraR/DksA C4-type zinc finger protein [uncultured Cardiobacterium sp.]|uniref:TraR/DksA C4-type zinc finger protein n=1 Tax=uncultured Cardiobacterium sp. TaxID=417619 RepID=UPI0034329973
MKSPPRAGTPLKKRVRFFNGNPRRRANPYAQRCTECQQYHEKTRPRRSKARHPSTASSTNNPRSYTNEYRVLAWCSCY